MIDVFIYVSSISIWCSLAMACFLFDKMIYAFKLMLMIFLEQVKDKAADVLWP